jgi:hypothetical protein
VGAVVCDHCNEGDHEGDPLGEFLGRGSDVWLHQRCWWHWRESRNRKIEMTFTDEQIEAAMHAGRRAVHGDDEGFVIRGYPPVDWWEPSFKPLADAWRSGWDEENAKLAEADFVKFTRSEDLRHVIANASHLICYRHHTLAMVRCLAAEYG